jgi:hypothetical protein
MIVNRKLKLLCIINLKLSHLRINLKRIEMSWDKKVFAYFMEMGTGKSKVSH